MFGDGAKQQNLVGEQLELGGANLKELAQAGAGAQALAGPSGSGSLRALIEEHHEKLRLMSLAIAVMAALLVTVVVIKYSGAHLRRSSAPPATDNGDQAVGSTSVQFGQSAGGGAQQNKSAPMFPGEHTCCRLRTKCTNLCSYARSAYGGLSDKAYKVSGGA